MFLSFPRLFLKKIFITILLVFWFLNTSAIIWTESWWGNIYIQTYKLHKMEDSRSWSSNIIKEGRIQNRDIWKLYFKILFKYSYSAGICFISDEKRVIDQNFWCFRPKNSSISAGNVIYSGEWIAENEFKSWRIEIIIDILINYRSVVYKFTIWIKF